MRYAFITIGLIVLSFAPSIAVAQTAPAERPASAPHADVLQAEAARIAAVSEASRATVAVFARAGQGGGSGVVITPGTDEEHYEAARAGRASPVPQLIHGLLASRREIERLLDEAATLPDGLDRTTTHPKLGPQSVAWILRAKVIDHEAEHVAQIMRTFERHGERAADGRVGVLLEQADALGVVTGEDARLGREHEAGHGGVAGVDDQSIPGNDQLHIGPGRGRGCRHVAVGSVAE